MNSNNNRHLIFYCRHHPEKHLMLQRYLRALRANGVQFDIVSFRSPGNLKTLVRTNSVVLCDDPVAFVIAKFLGHRRPQVLIALEMYEFQRRALDFYSIVRNFFFLVLHRFALWTASLVVFPNIERRDFYLAKVPSIESRSLIVRNLPDRNFFVEDTDEEIKETVRQLRESFRIIVLYSGALQEGRDLTVIIEAFKFIPHACLLLAGENKNLKLEGLPKNVVYLGRLDQVKLQTLYRIVDVGLLVYDLDLINSSLCAPVKLYEYLHYGLKIFSTKNRSLEKYRPFLSGFFSGKDELIQLVKDVPNPKEAFSTVYLEQEIGELLNQLNGISR